MRDKEVLRVLRTQCLSEENVSDGVEVRSDHGFEKSIAVICFEIANFPYPKWWDKVWSITVIYSEFLTTKYEINLLIIPIQMN